MPNLTADAMTRAAQLAAQELKLKLRDEGRRQTDPAMYGLRSAIGDLLRERPDIVERAMRDIQRWRSKFTSGAQKLRR